MIPKLRCKFEYMWPAYVWKAIRLTRYTQLQTERDPDEFDRELGHEAVKRDSSLDQRQYENDHLAKISDTENQRYLNRETVKPLNLQIITQPRHRNIFA